MKRLISLMIGLGLVLCTTATEFARAQTPTSKKKGNKKTQGEPTKKAKGGG